MGETLDAAIDERGRTVRGLDSLRRDDLGEDERTVQRRGGDGKVKRKAKPRNRPAFRRTLDHPHPRDTCSHR